MKKLNQIIEISDENEDKRTSSLHDSLMNHYGNTKISEDEHKSLKGYQSDSSALNKYHWIGDGSNQNFNKQSNNIDSVLNDLQTPHKLVVYSGTRRDPRDLKDENHIVHHPAYLSASIDKRPTNFFTPSVEKEENGKKIINTHNLKIHVPKGHPGAYLPAITDSQTNESEKEFLLPRNIKLQHIKTDTETQKGFSSFETRNHTHHMRIVP